MKIISNKKWKEINDTLDDYKFELEYQKDQYKIVNDQKLILIEDNKKKAFEIADLKIKLGDSNEFLRLEKECSNALRKERANLRRLLSKNGIEYKKKGDKNVQTKPIH